MKLDEVQNMGYEKFALFSKKIMPSRLYRYYPNLETVENANYSIQALEENTVFLQTPTAFDDVDRNLLLRFQRLIKESDNLADYYSKLSVALDLAKADAVKMINQTNQMMENYLDISKNIINQNIDD